VLRTEEIGRMAGLSRSRVIEAGDVVMEEGSVADAVVTVGSGMLKLYRTLPDGRRMITGFATSGDVVGLAAQGNYVYSAEAVTASRVCRTARASLDGMAADNPAVQGRMFAITAADLTAAQDQILMLGCKSATERVCTFLRAMARRGGKDESLPTAYLPMMRQDVAEYLGLRLETLSRVFRRLKDAGLITLLDKTRVRLDDPDRIAALASGAERLGSDN
jgi:CRP/FNR family transcriptional regulator, anaerobic regulatory protein